MPLRYYKYCLGRSDHFATMVARLVLAMPLLGVIFVALCRGTILLFDGAVFQRYPNIYALVSMGGFLSQFVWGAVEMTGGLLLTACSACYLLAKRPDVIRRILFVMSVLLVGQAVLSAGTISMILFSDSHSPGWVWFALRFGMATLSLLQVVCVLQGEDIAYSEQRLRLLSSGTDSEQRRRYRTMSDHELIDEHSRRCAHRRVASG